MTPSAQSRRQFLQFLAASPLFGYSGQQPLAPPPQSELTQMIMASQDDAVNVMDFEAAARASIPPAHFAYLETGVDDDATIAANRAAFSHIQLRPRRMVDVSHYDLGIELFGRKWETPIVIDPVGSQKAFHPDGEMATARAAKSRKTLQILSTVTTSPIEKVFEAAGSPIWYQLYATSKWEVTESLVKRAEATGCPVLVMTVDLTVGRNTETLTRGARLDSRHCPSCHPPGPQRFFGRYPMFQGIDTSGMTLFNPAMTWSFVRRVKQLSKMRLVLKGIETGEDAALCCENGVDGIVVSNHGGRAEESRRGTMECLPEVIAAVKGRIPVLVDGGFRRGTDIFKALAMGASAIGIGRPYVWGLGAFGQPGVEKVLDILRAELALVMRQCGVTSVSGIGPEFIRVKSNG